MDKLVKNPAYAAANFNEETLNQITMTLLSIEIQLKLAQAGSSSTAQKVTL
jgi:hypothetical protein